MKTLVRYDSKRKKIKKMEIKFPKLINENEAIIKIKYVGICGRDIEHYNSIIDKKKIPYVPGHEYSGLIYKLPNQYKGKFKKGDRVVGETVNYVCEKCNVCKSGNYNLCKYRKNIGGTMEGAYSPYIKIPLKYIHKLPSNISLKESALLEPLSVCYNAIIINSKVKKGDTVIIFGTGTIGLICLKILKYLKAKVVIVGTSKDILQLDLSKKIGASLALKYNNKIEEVLRKEIINTKIPLIIDTVGGVSETFKKSIDIISPGGQITKIGWFMKPLKFNLDKIIRKNLKIQGTFSHNYEIWENSIKLLSSNKINLKDIISNVMYLNQWKKAYNLLEKRKSIKILLKH